MTKFRLLDSPSVLASVKDPVALDCISKLAQNVSDITAVSTGQQLEQQDHAGSLLTKEPTPVPQVDNLPCSTNQDLSTISELTAVTEADPSDYNVKFFSQSVSTIGQPTSVASELPLFFAPHDLLSLPVITLPLVACSIASNDIPTSHQTTTSSKSFVTVAINSVPGNVIIKQNL